MQHLSGVLLDVDGTLVDSNNAHAQAWHRALADNGITVPLAKILRLIGKGGDKLLPEVAGIEADSPEGKVISKRRGEIFQADFLPSLRSFPRVEELLARIKQQGLRLGIASSAHADELNKLLQVCGADKYVEARTSSDDADKSKPDPDIVEAALNRLGLKAEKTILVGDSPYDIEAAKHAGVAAVALRCGGWSDADLAGAIKVYDNPADLLDHFAESPFMRELESLRRTQETKHMPVRKFDPKLNKKRLFVHADYTAFTVNGFAVRNASQPDEEFGSFATHDEFSDVIEKHAVWISEKLAPKEGLFFLANALTYLARQAAGATDKAYDDAIAVERTLRERINGIEYRNGQPHKQIPDSIYLDEYLTLPDPKGPVTVRLVDGNLVRSYYKTDYTQGGHNFVYPWVPKSQIWVEDGVDHREIHFIVCHEYLERRLMRDKDLGYDYAHDIASQLEFDLRKGQGLTPLMTSGQRKINKGDLPKLTTDEVFAFVLKTYLGK